MRNSIYIKNYIYKFGGTESFTSRLIYSLQVIFPKDEIIIITEHYSGTEYLKTEDFIETINRMYGTSINCINIKIQYIEVLEKYQRFSSFLLQKRIFKITKKCDRFFYCSRGLVTGKAKNNICIVHFPPEKKSSFPFYNKFKIFMPVAKKTDENFRSGYDIFIPNSDFTASYLKKFWNISDEKIKMTYHPVNLLSQNCHKEKGTILICSRIEKSKKIEELINAYRSSSFLLENCSLTVAGSIKNESADYKDYITKLCPKVKFVFEPSNQELQALYSKSEVFWHAKGFGETNPYLMEHFGLTTVEAMSVGCVPVVIDKGGQKEIVQENCGFKWNTLEELVQKTELLFKDTELLNKMSENAKKKGRILFVGKFYKKIKRGFIDYEKNCQNSETFFVDGKNISSN